MRKIVAIGIILLIILSNVTVLASSNVEFSISNQENIKPGDTVKLDLIIENVEKQEKKISGIKLDVFYDTSVFEFVSAKHLEAANEAICLHENYTDEGRIRIGGASLTGLEESGKFYEINLKAKTRNKKK